VGPDRVVLDARDDAVAATVHGFDDASAPPTLVEGASEFADAAGQHVLADVHATPNDIEKLALFDQARSGGDQVSQHRESLGAKLGRASVADYAFFVEIDFEVGELDEAARSSHGGPWCAVRVELCAD